MDHEEENLKLRKAELELLFTMRDLEARGELLRKATRDFRLSFNVIVAYGLGLACFITAGFLQSFALAFWGILFFFAAAFAMIYATNRRIDALIKLMDIEKERIGANKDR